MISGYRRRVRCRSSATTRRTLIALGALNKFSDVELTPDEALEIARALTLLAAAVKAERAPQL